MDLIAGGVDQLRNIESASTDLDRQLQARKEELAKLQNKLQPYAQR